MPVGTSSKKNLALRKNSRIFDLMNNKPSVIRFVLSSSSFHWAVSDSIEGAAKMLYGMTRKQSYKVWGTMVVNDERPFISADGALCYGGKEAPDAWILHLGPLGKIGGLIQKDR
jgi:hypothetical protein